MSINIHMSIEVDTGGEQPYVCDLYDRSMTHNVRAMWIKAGVYDAIYNSHGKLAGSISEELSAGLRKMVASPDEYTKLNPPNGWGDYERAVAFLDSLDIACRQHPKATIYVWK